MDIAKDHINAEKEEETEDAHDAPRAGALDLEDEAESDPELLSNDLKSASHTIMDISV